MTLNRGSRVARSIRTRSIAPGAARWPPLIWAPSKAGPVGLEAASSRSPVAQHDLGVRADVDDELDRLGPVGRLGQDHPGGVRADVAGDARQDVDPGARVGPDPDLGGGRPDRPVGGQGERRRAERDRVDPEQEVVHDRVADDRHLEDLARRHVRPGRPARRRAWPARRGRPGSSRRRPRDASSRTRPGSSGPRRTGSAGSSPRSRRGPTRRTGRPGGRRSSSSRRRSRRRTPGRGDPGQMPVSERPSWTATVTL